MPSNEKCGETQLPPAMGVVEMGAVVMPMPGAGIVSIAIPVIAVRMVAMAVMASSGR